MPQTAEEWIKIITALVVGLIIPAYLAYKRGKLNDFLTQELEPRLNDVAKKAVEAKAIDAGVQGTLDATLKANGLSSGKEEVKP